MINIYSTIDYFYRIIHNVMNICRSFIHSYSLFSTFYMSVISFGSSVFQLTSFTFMPPAGKKDTVQKNESHGIIIICKHWWCSLWSLPSVRLYKKKQRCKIYMQRICACLSERFTWFNRLFSLYVLNSHFAWISQQLMANFIPFHFEFTSLISFSMSLYLNDKNIQLFDMPLRVWI